MGPSPSQTSSDTASCNHPLPFKKEWPRAILIVVLLDLITLLETVRDRGEFSPCTRTNKKVRMKKKNYRRRKIFTAERFLFALFSLSFLALFLFCSLLFYSIQPHVCLEMAINKRVLTNGQKEIHT